MKPLPSLESSPPHSSTPIHEIPSWQAGSLSSPPPRQPRGPPSPERGVKPSPSLESSPPHSSTPIHDIPSWQAGSLSSPPPRQPRGPPSPERGVKPPPSLESSPPHSSTTMHDAPSSPDPRVEKVAPLLDAFPSQWMGSSIQQDCNCNACENPSPRFPRGPHQSVEHPLNEPSTVRSEPTLPWSSFTSAWCHHDAALVDELQHQVPHRARARHACMRLVCMALS